MAKWTIPDMIPRVEADRQTREAVAAVLMEAARIARAAPDGEITYDDILALTPDAADRIEELEAKLAKVKASYRRNMMQAYPAYTHEQFDKDYEEMMGGKDER